MEGTMKIYVKIDYSLAEFFKTRKNLISFRGKFKIQGRPERLNFYFEKFLSWTIF